MPLGRFRTGVFDVATVQDTHGVLVAEPREPPIEYREYVLYLHAPGEDVLRPSSEGVGLTARTVVDGTLVARAGSFLAVLLTWRDVEGEGGPWAGLHLAEWSTEGELLRTADVSEVPVLSDMECREAAGFPCDTRASFRREGDDTILVTLVAPPELYRARIDLEAWSVSEMATLALPEDRRIGEPIATLVRDSGTFFAAVGGPAPWSLARPSTLIAFDGMGGSPMAQEIPGLSYDPPAVLATVDEGPTLWRFVTDASQPLESAVRGWRLTSDGMGETSDWTIPTSMGFRPSFVQVLESEAQGGVVVWVSPDPRDAERSALSLLRLRPDFEECERLTPVTAAQFPWPVQAVASRPMTALLDDDESLLVAVLGDRAGGDIPLVLLRIPACE